MKTESLEPYEWDMGTNEMMADAANLEAFASWGPDENFRMSKNLSELLRNGASAIRWIAMNYELIKEMKMPKIEKPRLLSDKEINTIRGKASVGNATRKELLQVFGHIDSLETELDKLDLEDALGTEGWRHHFSHPDAD